MARRYETLAAASDRTGVSIKTLRRRISKGALHAYRSGRILRVDPDDVDGMFHTAPAGGLDLIVLEMAAGGR